MSGHHEMHSEMKVVPKKEGSPGSCWADEATLVEVIQPYSFTPEVYFVTTRS